MTEETTVQQTGLEAEETLAASTTADEVEQTEEQETLLGKVKVDAPAVPEKYEFKAPEGFSVDEKTVETITPIFKELGISQEGAQKLVDSYAPVIKQQMEAAIESQRQQSQTEFKSLVKGWEEESKKILGTEFDKKIGVMAKVLDKAGTKELRQLLNDTGVGNHPELIKFVLKIGEMISEDSFVEPKTTSISSGPDLNKLYPTMKT